MKHKKFEEMLILYSWNELKKEERIDLERHLLGCDSCKNELAELTKFHEMIKIHFEEELDENVLFEARHELLAEIRNLNRKKFQLKNIWDFLTTPSINSLKLAYSFASAAIIFIAGYFLFFKGSDGVMKPGKELTQIESDVTNLQFISSDFDKGEVEISFNQITPVTLKGNVNDPQIQKVLAQSLIGNENPGVRLKTVNAIQSEKTASASHMLKDALIKAMMYDSNPGVRKEAMNVLCNLQYDSKIQDAMIYVLQNDKNSGIRIQAINCLDKLSDMQKINDPNTINVLKRKMEEDENSYIKLRAKTILTKLES